MAFRKMVIEGEKIGIRDKGYCDTSVKGGIEELWNDHIYW